MVEFGHRFKVEATRSRVGVGGVGIIELRVRIRQSVIRPGEEALVWCALHDFLLQPSESPPALAVKGGHVDIKDAE